MEFKSLAEELCVVVVEILRVLLHELSEATEGFLRRDYC